MLEYDRVKSELQSRPRCWLVTGCAGFIGSHLVEELLRLDQRVIGLDDLSFGSRGAVKQIEALVTPDQWSRFEFIRGDVCDRATCAGLCAKSDYVLHHAAMASVPKSIQEPLAANECNVSGFLNLLVAARDSEIKGFVFASSSAVYGNRVVLPVSEDMDGVPLSPYAAAKKANELYAAAFAAVYGFSSVALRYFNCFGGRQRVDGPYASVIPIWLNAVVNDQPLVIYGDGSSTRDYVHIADVVQANILASVLDLQGQAKVFNAGSGVQTSLDDLCSCLDRVAREFGFRIDCEAIKEPFRIGDIAHSCADISRAQAELGYTPRVGLDDGLRGMFSAMKGDDQEMRQAR